MIGCDGCDKWYHWSCVGINQKNKPGKKDDWFCPNCQPNKQDNKPNGKVNPIVKTLAQKKSFDVNDKIKPKESWVTSSDRISNDNASALYNESSKNEDDELNSYQASSSSQKSSKPNSDIIQSSETDDSIFQDFMFENQVVISEEPEVKLKIQLSKKTDFRAERAEREARGGDKNESGKVIIRIRKSSKKY